MTNTIIGNKIRTLRKQKGWSQEQVADSLHVSQSTYARIESGESCSWATHLQSISNLFEIEPEELLKQESNTFNQNNKKGNNNGIVINQLSEKLIEQYELRIKEKDAYILKLEKLLEVK